MSSAAAIEGSLRRRWADDVSGEGAWRAPKWMASTSGHPTPGVRPLWRPAPWHLALPTTAPPKRAPEFLVTGLASPDCAGPVWLASTATDQEFRWFGRLFTAGADDLLLLRCSDCGGNAWMNVPAPGGVGSSPDFDSGPIIPNALFPIHVFGKTLQNRKVFSETDFYVPALDQNLDPPFSVDGHSHFPVFIADNPDIACAFGGSCDNTNLLGPYRYEFTLMDSTGQGWRVTADFTVAP
jgi:hypothetical protein